MGYCSDQLNGVQEARRVKDKALTDRGVTLVSTTDGIDSSTPASRMMIGVLGSLAEYERELVQGAHGVEAAGFSRERHQVRAAQEGKDGNNIATARRMKADGHTARDIAKYFGVSRATLYRYLVDEPA